MKEKRLSAIEQMYDNYYNGQELLWGVRSAYSPIDKADIGGLNDADLIYDKADDVYRLSIESSYIMDTNEQEFEYFSNIRKDLLKWCNDNHVKLNDCVECKDNQDSWNFEGDSIKDVVSQFECYFADFFRLEYA